MLGLASLILYLTRPAIVLSLARQALRPLLGSASLYPLLGSASLYPLLGLAWLALSFNGSASLYPLLGWTLPSFILYLSWPALSFTWLHQPLSITFFVRPLSFTWLGLASIILYLACGVQFAELETNKSFFINSCLSINSQALIEQSKETMKQINIYLMTRPSSDFIFILHLAWPACILYLAWPACILYLTWPAFVLYLARPGQHSPLLGKDTLHPLLRLANPYPLQLGSASVYPLLSLASLYSLPG